MITGTSGFVERSRVQAAARRVPSVVYNKSEAPGTGAATVATDDIDPYKQAERFVARVAGQGEVQWADRRMREYSTLREMRLKIANFRHDHLRRAVASSELAEGAVAQAVKRGWIPAGTTAAASISSEATADGSEGGTASSAARRFLLEVAAPEQLASLLPEHVVQEIEIKVMQLKQALADEFAAQKTN